MSSPSYTQPRLAAVYDPLNPASEEDDFFLDLAGSEPCRVLDLGCGTGRLACAFASRGHRVTGADPAEAMLAIARNRPGGGSVAWVENDAASLALDGHFDLIVLAGHVFQVFLDDAEVRIALAALRRHLAPVGRLAFATRNPLVRDWETWTPEATRERLDLADDGPAEVHYAIRSVVRELVTFETHFHFGPGDDVVTLNTLRFMSRERLAGFLADAGFGRVAWYGDWNRAPFVPASPEIIVVAEDT
jgi:SAM-dependent methyltransferase